MFSATTKYGIRGKDLRKAAKAVPLSLRNSINKAGAIERRRIAGRIVQATGLTTVEALRTRVHHYPSKLGSLESTITVLSPQYEDDGPVRYTTRKPMYTMPTSILYGERPIKEPSLEEYVDGIMEEFEDLIGGHFLRYLGSISGLVD